MQLPTFQQIESLHKKYAPSPEAFDSVFTHCQIVRDIALQLIDKGNVNVAVEVVEAGCLLHDIGAYRLFEGGAFDKANYIRHGVLGEELLRQEGYGETLCHIASHHTGVGLTKEDVQTQHLPLPVDDYMATTDEERLVMYADKFHSKSMPPHFNSFVSYKQLVSRFGQDKAAEFEAMAKQFGLPDLDALKRQYNQPIK